MQRRVCHAVADVLDGGSWFPALTAERSAADSALAQRLAQLTPQQFEALGEAMQAIRDGLRD